MNCGVVLAIIANILILMFMRFALVDIARALFRVFGLLPMIVDIAKGCDQEC